MPLPLSPEALPTSDPLTSLHQKTFEMAEALTSCANDSNSLHEVVANERGDLSTKKSIAFEHYHRTYACLFNALRVKYNVWIARDAFKKAKITTAPNEDTLPLTLGRLKVALDYAKHLSETSMASIDRKI